MKRSQVVQVSSIQINKYTSHFHIRDHMELTKLLQAGDHIEADRAFWYSLVIGFCFSFSSPITQFVSCTGSLREKVVRYFT